MPDAGISPTLPKAGQLVGMPAVTGNSLSLSQDSCWQSLSPSSYTPVASLTGPGRVHPKGSGTRQTERTNPLRPCQTVPKPGGAASRPSAQPLDFLRLWLEGKGSGAGLSHRSCPRGHVRLRSGHLRGTKIPAAWICLSLPRFMLEQAQRPKAYPGNPGGPPEEVRERSSQQGAEITPEYATHRKRVAWSLRCWAWLMTHSFLTGWPHGLAGWASA